MACRPGLPASVRPWTDRDANLHTVCLHEFNSDTRANYLERDGCSDGGRSSGQRPHYR